MGGVSKPKVKWYDTHAFVTRKGQAGARSLCGVPFNDDMHLSTGEQCHSCKQTLKRRDFVSFIPRKQ